MADRADAKPAEVPPKKPKKILIAGETESGEKFRPADWAERMSGNLSTFHRHRMVYSPLLQPVVKNGQKCVLLDPALKNDNPALYEAILNFVESNKLKTSEDE